MLWRHIGDMVLVPIFPLTCQHTDTRMKGGGIKQSHGFSVLSVIVAHGYPGWAATPVWSNESVRKSGLCVSAAMDIFWQCSSEYCVWRCLWQSQVRASDKCQRFEKGRSWSPSYIFYMFIYSVLIVMCKCSLF